jgi:hypothetical protein
MIHVQEKLQSLPDDRDFASFAADSPRFNEKDELR